MIVGLFNIIQRCNDWAMYLAYYTIANARHYQSEAFPFSNSINNSVRMLKEWKKYCSIFIAVVLTSIFFPYFYSTFPAACFSVCYSLKKSWLTL